VCGDSERYLGAEPAEVLEEVPEGSRVLFQELGFRVSCGREFVIDHQLIRFCFSEPTQRSWFGLRVSGFGIRVSSLTCAGPAGETVI